MAVNTPVYMDYSATTPCDERVVAEMLPYFTAFFGNSSSRAHSFGWKAEAAVEQARERIARLIKAQPREIIFTSGATEACNLALRGVFDMYAVKGNHIIVAKTEHKAVLDTCKALEKSGAEITWLPVDQNGQIDAEELERSIKPATILLAVMWANNETGVLQHIQEIAAICKHHKVLFFTDATQAVGKIPVDVMQDQADLLSFSSHKLYGPKGVGALYIRSRNPRVKLRPQITGGGQEQQVRSGTLNVAGIVGFGKACDICHNEMDNESARLAALRNQLQTRLQQLPGFHLNGHALERLPHVLNVSFKDLNSSLLLSALCPTVALSSGSACTSGSLGPSYVLSAMGLPDTLSKAALRFSIGRFTSQNDIDITVAAVTETVTRLQSELLING